MNIYTKWVVSSLVLLASAQASEEKIGQRFVEKYKGPSGISFAVYSTKLDKTKWPESAKERERYIRSVEEIEIHDTAQIPHKVIASFKSWIDAASMQIPARVFPVEDNGVFVWRLLATDTHTFWTLEQMQASGLTAETCSLDFLEKEKRGTTFTRLRKGEKRPVK